MSSHPTPAPHRPEIDGLRAVAVLPVIAFHAGVRGFAGGFVGVDVFFVISGFLITSIVQRELSREQFSFARFWERRARRILPALLLVLLVTVPAAWWWLLPDDFASYAASLAAVTVFASNVVFWRQSGYFDGAAELKPLLHTWSLAVEEQYYLIFPLILVGLWRAARRAVWPTLAITAVLGLAAAQWSATHRPAAAFYLLPTRAWELLAGALLALAMARVSASAPPTARGRALRELGATIGLAAIVLAIGWYDSATPFPGVAAALPVSGTVLVLACAYPDTRVGRLLAWAPFVGVGLVSYSAYLWHQPLLAFARHRVGDAVPPALTATLVAATLALAWVSWRFVETPFRDARRVSRRQLVVTAGVLSLLLGVVGLLGWHSGGWPERLPGPVRAVLATASTHAAIRRDGRCLRSATQVTPEACVWRGATLEASPAPAATGGTSLHDSVTTAPRVVLLGDSHASALARPLAMALAAEGAALPITLVQHTKSGCALARGLVNRAGTSCAAYLDSLLAQVDTMSPTAFVVSARWSFPVTERPRGVAPGAFGYSVRGTPLDAPFADRRDAVLRGMTETLRALAQRGVPVVLVEPIPEPAGDVPRALARVLLSGRGLAELGGDATGGVADITRTAHVAQHAAVLQAFAALDNVRGLTRVSAWDALCGATAVRCAVHEGATPLFYDDHHLAEAGAARVARAIVRAMAPALDAARASAGAATKTASLPTASRAPVPQRVRAP